MANDGYVQPPANTGVGPKVDTTELTRPDAAIIERQRIAIPGSVLVDADIFRQILIELRVISIILSEGNKLLNDLGKLRDGIATEDHVDYIDRRQADFS